RRMCHQKTLQCMRPMVHRLYHRRMHLHQPTLQCLHHTVHQRYRRRMHLHQRVGKQIVKVIKLIKI
ncbi:hypothetical protein, partial [Aneurinibacillus tyrosinisolvens]|uniref:hypothetical protein n=1 Tax=Aneurinibacillus tyrosinisolvens TaxID=1443435 RepID=UPI001F273649